MSDDIKEGDEVDYNSPHIRGRRGTVKGVWITPGGHTRYGVQWHGIPASTGLSGTPGFYGTYPTRQLSKVVE